MRKRLAFLVFIACLMCNLFACGNSVDKNEAAKNDARDSGAKATNDKEEASNNEPEGNDSSTDKSENPDDTMTEYQKLFQYGPLLVTDENYNWGYIDESGEYVIEPIFSKANPFGSNGLATVQETDSELWGIIDSSGNYVIEPMYAHLGTGFQDGLLSAREPGCDAGYIDESGEYVIEPQFTAAYNFNNGFARVSSQPMLDNGVYLMGYIDTSGKRITEDIFPVAEDFRGDRACVQMGGYTGGTYGYIDTTGNVAIEPLYTGADGFSNGVAFVSIKDAAGGETRSLIDKEGNVIYSGSDYSHGHFNSGLCPVSTTHNEYDYTDTDYVYLNPDGEAVLPKEGAPYENAYDFQEEYAAVMDAESHLWGYIDTEGNWVVQPQYVKAFSYQKGVAFVATDRNELQGGLYFYSGFQLIDTSGKCVMKFDSSVMPVFRSFYGSEQMTPILSTQRVAIERADEYGNPKIDENGVHKMGLCDYNNNLVVDYIFDRIESIADDSSYVKVSYNGLWGMIDMDGNWLVQPNFTCLY